MPTDDERSERQRLADLVSDRGETDVAVVGLLEVIGALLLKLNGGQPVVLDRDLFDEVALYPTVRLQADDDEETLTVAFPDEPGPLERYADEADE